MQYVKQLKNLIAYQDQSIVSHTLIDRPAGTVTVFAFAAGQGLSEHTAPYDALVQILEGEAEILIAGSPSHLQAGDFIVMPAEIAHAVKSVSAFKMVLTMIKG